MLCPACGAPMNRHAEKTIKTSGGDDVPAAIHFCSACGKVEAEIENGHLSGINSRTAGM